MDGGPIGSEADRAGPKRCHQCGWVLAPVWNFFTCPAHVRFQSPTTLISSGLFNPSLRPSIRCRTGRSPITVRTAYTAPAMNDSWDPIRSHSARDDTSCQHRDSGHQIEHPVCGFSEFQRGGVCDERREQALREALVHRTAPIAMPARLGANASISSLLKNP